MLDSRKTLFLQALRLPPDLTDEACTHAVSELISRVAGEQSTVVSLKDIQEAVLHYDCAAYLEPLDVLPTLLPCRRDGAMDLIHVCALNNSPKEVMIVVQEAIECMQTRLANDEDEEDPNLVQRAIGIVALCSPAITRSTLGRRSARELCSPVLENVTSLMTAISPFGTREEGRTLMTDVARLVTSLSAWASAVADASGVQEIKRLLRELLDTTVISCAPSIQASLAVRAAERYFPRLFVKSPAKKGWEGGEGAMLNVQLALEQLGHAPQSTHWTLGSLSDLVYLAHATPPVVLSTSDLHPLLVGALQTNTVVDESLFLLLRILTEENMGISPEVATSLCTVFTALASTHLDPTMRQLNLRLLSLTLTKLSPPARLDMLLKLTTDEDFPQIRGPAVGLVKEAVLEALALPAGHASRRLFASPEMLRTFGGVLFSPHPPEFFRGRKRREELAASLELLRIADCLSFYYVLVRRDRDNETGVRSKSHVMHVRRAMLRPVGRFLEDNATKEPLPAMLSLQVGLERIDGALHALGVDDA